MVGTIGPVQQIVAAIRAEMAGRVQAGAAPRRAAAKPARGQASRSGTLIAERVRALDPADPDRGRKAFRIFLESVLLAELGEELINDHGFLPAGGPGAADHGGQSADFGGDVEGGGRLLEPGAGRR
jgi:hypothetical protein